MSTLPYIKIATNNKNELIKSDNFYCVYCLKKYDLNFIEQWTDGGTTAICSVCSVDAVIPSTYFQNNRTNQKEIMNTLRKWRKLGFETFD